MVRLVTHVPRISLVQAVLGPGFYFSSKAFRLHQVVQVPADSPKSLALNNLLTNKPILPPGFAAAGERASSSVAGRASSLAERQTVQGTKQHCMAPVLPPLLCMSIV
jgi:hypothetical protein